MSAGGSARRRADELRGQAAAARAKAADLEREAGAWEAGAEGERLVANELARLLGPWRVLHDRLLRPGRSKVNLDHVAVGPGGVFLIDAKHWSGRVSVYDGTLWQHNGSHLPQRRALEQVCRAAAEMEQVLGVPVTPVIALTGPASTRFAPSRVGGVDVLSVRALRAWLTQGPALMDVAGIESVLRRAEMAFPPAATPHEVLGAEPTHRPSQPSARASTGLRRGGGAPVASRRTRRRGNAAAKFAVALLVLAVAPTVLPILAKAASGVVAGAVGPPRPTTSCKALAPEQIAAVLGAPVSVVASTVDSRCSWRVTNSASAAVPAVTIQIHAQSADSTSSQPMLSAQAGRAVARLAQGQRLPGWAATTVAPASFSVSLQYSYPAKATRAEREKADANALVQLGAIAEEFARSATPTR